MTEFGEDQMSLFPQDTWCLKMSLEHSQLETPKAQTSKPSLKKPSASQSRKLPLFLYLRRDGTQADASLMVWDDGASLGELPMPSTGECHKGEDEFAWWWTSMGLPHLKSSLAMLNFGEAPRVPVETRLSDILEPNADERYHLSKKACEGILRRAHRRGKKLPEMLEAALRAHLWMRGSITDGE